MSDTFTFTIDGVEVAAEPGQTILEAAQNAGIYIPRLCHRDGLEPAGACRVCTVMVDGRPQTACNFPASEGVVVDNETDQLLELRRDIIDMLFVEGNHWCMFCEKSGDCELQALAYRFGIAAPSFPFQFPADRQADLSHPDIWIDRDRCILCGRCVRASRDLDGKHVFDFVDRGPAKRIAVNAEARLRDTDADVTDEALEVCPVGALMKKGTGFDVPVGRRTYDWEPIGSEIEKRQTQE